MIRWEDSIFGNSEGHKLVNIDGLELYKLVYEIEIKLAVRNATIIIYECDGYTDKKINEDLTTIIDISKININSTNGIYEYCREIGKNIIKSHERKRKIKNIL